MKNNGRNNIRSGQRQFVRQQRQQPVEDPIDALCRRIERSLTSVQDAYPDEYGVRVAGLLEAALFLAQNGVNDGDSVDPSDAFDDDPSEVQNIPNNSRGPRSLRDQWAGGLPGHPQQIADALASDAGPAQSLRVTGDDAPSRRSRKQKPSKKSPNQPSGVAHLRDSRNGLSGGDPTQFKIATSVNSPGLDVYPDPAQKCYVCGGCNGDVAGHARDHNLPERGGNVAVILCDTTRLYLPKEQVEAVPQ